MFKALIYIFQTFEPGKTEATEQILLMFNEQHSWLNIFVSNMILHLYFVTCPRHVFWLHSLPSEIRYHDFVLVNGMTFTWHAQDESVGRTLHKEKQMNNINITNYTLHTAEHT